MNTLQLQKFEGVAKVLKILSKTAWILSFIVCGITVIGAIAALIIPTDTLNSLLSLIDTVTLKEGIMANLTIKDASFNLQDFMPEAGNLKTLAVSICLWGVIASLAMAFLFILINRILTQVVNKTPFAPKAINSIKLLALFIVVYSLVSSLIQMIIGRLFLSTFNLTSMLLESNAVSTAYNLDVKMIFVGLLVLLLAKIFEYGASLQQEVDEML